MSKSHLRFRVAFLCFTKKYLRTFIGSFHSYFNRRGREEHRAFKIAFAPSVLFVVLFNRRGHEVHGVFKMAFALSALLVVFI
ncbi:hypothetical protein GCM10023091_09690 [Ravibacter arvi]|uniref:Uncharacterized protein n=1 Tax=Ravibacter arvi TaxID=2051041 RepID=A0ABP8LU79_9BACT